MKIILCGTCGFRIAENTSYNEKTAKVEPICWDCFKCLFNEAIAEKEAGVTLQ